MYIKIASYFFIETPCTMYMSYFKHAKIMLNFSGYEQNLITKQQQIMIRGNQIKYFSPLTLYDDGSNGKDIFLCRPRIQNIQ